MWVFPFGFLKKANLKAEIMKTNDDSKLLLINIYKLLLINIIFYILIHISLSSLT